MQDRQKLEGPQGQRKRVNMNNRMVKTSPRPEPNCEYIMRQSVLLQLKQSRMFYSHLSRKMGIN